MRKDKHTGKMVYSATDLIRFMESPFASWMERLSKEQPDLVKPDAETEELQLIAATGDKHEAEFLASLKKERRDIVEIDSKDPDAFAKTVAAMTAGREIIYQGCLQAGEFIGFTDFLVRDTSTPNGEIRYEIWDTKLARKPKPYYLVQLCCYAEMMETIVGTRPQKLRVVLGNLEIPAFNTADFFYYYRGLKQAFLEQMATFDPGSPPEPDPRADHGRWASYADKRLRDLDHLVRVANITVGQIKKLQAAGISTVSQLAGFTGQGVDGLAADALSGLVEQAQLQIATEKRRQVAKPDEVVPAEYRILTPDGQNRRGFALLPPASSGDAYFDMEGYPLLGQGLEYLFGAVYMKDGKPIFCDWWAHDAEEEKLAFEQFVDWAYARWIAHPNMHIYHYANYEVAALRKLMGRHGTREDQVDDLLRGNVFVDLYQVVKQGLRVGEESYSIKYIEHLYRPARQGAVATAGQSIVEYARWMESGEPRNWEKSTILQGIRDYNCDDCISTVQLAEWLRIKQKEAGLKYVPAASRAEAKADPVKDAEKAAAFAELQRLVKSLDQKALAAREVDKRAVHVICSDLVGFHRREEKPVWWRMFDRAAMTHQELKDDIACIGEAVLASTTGVKVDKSLAFDYQFDPTQDTKLAVEKKIMPVENLDVKFEILTLDETGFLRVKVGGPTLKKLGGAMPALTSFLPVEVISSEALRDALHAVITTWEQKETLPPALAQFLRRQPPSVAGVKPGEPLRKSGEDAVAAAVRIVSAMDAATLCLQGPPGTGKTYTASCMIQALLGQGKRVGVTSNSHKAILHLLRSCNERMNGKLAGIKVGESGEDPFFAEVPGVKHVESSTTALGSYQGGVVAGTAWLFTRPEWVGQLDYLFVDEAGQVSLANLTGMSRATKNIVLLGDQMQLEQPIQGTHPGESGSSALNYFLAGHATIPESLGLFLPESRRMHPEICRFISDLAYEGRLRAATGNEQQRLLPVAGGKHPLDQLEAGVMFEPVVHDGNVQASDEEVAHTVELASRLIGRGCVDRDGKTRKLGWGDILFVAPYNLQVRKLREKLPPEARVGSVDKFQGQEAPVVFASMCSSYGEYGSRGIEFILDENRMNVAISRAQVLAIVVGDPRIALTPVVTIDGMRRLNLYCRLVQECRRS
ncbi:MAG TPA: TM0106 family RecB-like putative nuclease [Lacunisphaera sp.]|nr:TM0106 family RecB-like putative nuclease [Lacunisphaera sp.]